MRFSILPDATMCEDTSVGACNVGLLSEGTCRFRAGKRRTSEGHNSARVQAFNHIGEGRDVHDISFGWFWRALSGRADADAACTQESRILL